MKKETVELTFDDDSKVILPLKSGNEGPKSMDVSSLYKDKGIFTYDPGFMSTASCESSITFIDGEKGTLLYRGYSIEELAERSNFMETCFLLLYGNLPNKSGYESFVSKIKEHYVVHEQLKFLYRGYPRHAHPMAIMSGAFSSLSAFYHDSLDIRIPEMRELAAHRMIAKIPTLAAWAYKYSIGQPFIYPREDLDYASNFLHMFFHSQSKKYEISPTLAKVMDMIFILHADHEQNASTSTVRLAGSTGANPFACISAGISSLWGPAHGGANEEVIKMLEEINHVKHIPEYIKKAKDKDDPFRLMGFGHRVYKNYDPRASVLRKACHDVLNEIGEPNRLLDIAKELEKIALNDDYFVTRKLYPNVDFYSGIIYKAMGIPVQMYTVLFAIARTAGWVAQWKEMCEDPKQKIGRPRQIYKGSSLRKYVPVKKR